MDHECPPPEFGKRKQHPAARIQKRIAFIRDRDLGSLATAEMLFDLLGQIMHIDDRTCNAGRGEPVEHMVDQRPPGEPHQGLWQELGQRAHPLALSGGQNECARDALGGTHAEFVSGNLSDRQGTRAQRLRQVPVIPRGK